MERADFIVRNVKGRLLDVGYACGTLHRKIIDKLGKKNVYGLDIETEIKDSLHKTGSAENMPFKDNMFDCIVAGELIEHLENPEAFLEECNRMLKEKGRLILTTPNRKSLVNRITRSYEAPAHLSLFSEKELAGLLKEKGFKVKKTAYFPYTEESNYGSRHKWSFTLRNLLHKILPDYLKENMATIAERV